MTRCAFDNSVWSVTDTTLFPERRAIYQCLTTWFKAQLHNTNFSILLCLLHGQSLVWNGSAIGCPGKMWIQFASHNVQQQESPMCMSGKQKGHAKVQSNEGSGVKLCQQLLIIHHGENAATAWTVHKDKATSPQQFNDRLLQCLMSRLIQGMQQLVLPKAEFAWCSLAHKKSSHGLSPATNSGTTCKACSHLCFSLALTVTTVVSLLCDWQNIESPHKACCCHPCLLCRASCRLKADADCHHWQGCCGSSSC